MNLEFIAIQSIVVKVLSQTTSSSNCERNRSIFNYIHTSILQPEFKNEKKSRRHGTQNSKWLPEISQI